MRTRRAIRQDLGSRLRARGRPNAASLGRLLTLIATLLGMMTITAARVPAAPIAAEVSVACDALTTSVVNLGTRARDPNLVRACVTHDARALHVDATISRITSGTAGSRVNGTGFGDADFFGIGVDPSGRGDDVYYFIATPLGTRYELAQRSARFHREWSAAVRVEQGRWHVAFTIPFAAFAWTAKSRAVCRFNVVAQLAGSDERYTGAYDPSMFDAQPPAWPRYADSRYWERLALQAPTPLVAREWRRTTKAYLLEATGSNRNVVGLPEGGSAVRSLREMGADASAELSETLKITAALRPDYSNVDSDQVVVTPQEFRRRVDEYRPFFAEDALLFATPVMPTAFYGYQPFYTPQFDGIDVGLKVRFATRGVRVAAMSFSGIGADGNVDGSTQVSLLGSDPGHSYDWWVLHGSSLLAAQHGEVTQVGGARRIARLFTLSSTLARSSGSGAGDAVDAGVSYRHDDTRANVAFSSYSPRFSPLAGYVPVTDIRGVEGLFYTKWQLARSRVRSFGLFLGADRYVDASGAAHVVDSSLAAEFTLRGIPLRIYGGANVSTLRSYADDGLGGARTYADPITQYFNRHTVELHWREQTPHALSLIYLWGPYATDANLRELDGSMRLLAGKVDVALTLDKIWGHTAPPTTLFASAIGSQFDQSTEASLAQRNLTSGGFSHNTAIVVHRRTSAGETYISFGTPAARRTVNRFLVKHVFPL